jgi:hypothetical protein
MISSSFIIAHQWAVATFMSSFSIVLLTISSSFMVLLIDGQLQLSCRLIVTLLAINSCDFHVIFYSGLEASPTLLWDLTARLEAVRDHNWSRLLLPQGRQLI